jgi:hypothetical protein
MTAVEPVRAGEILPGDALVANRAVMHSRACLVTGLLPIGTRVRIDVIEGSVFESTDQWQSRTITFDADQRVGRLRKA